MLSTKFEKVFEGNKRNITSNYFKITALEYDREIPRILFFRSRKKFSTTYAIVLFFFSRTFHENFKFLKNCPYDFHEICTVILHPKGPLRVQRHQNRIAGM